MLDLGRSLVASVARSPDAPALAQGGDILNYGTWFGRVSSGVALLDDLGLRRGDRLVSILQNTADAATLHWACQLAGVTIVPVNWRSSPEDIGFVIENAEARAVVFDDAAAQAVASTDSATGLPRVSAGRGFEGVVSLPAALGERVRDATPRAGPEDWSLMLYTSGTTARPKGVPRRHRMERAAAVAHVAQNLLPRGDRTLGVMPLYHTMGVRSLLSASLVDGLFVCLPKFDPALALAAIADHRLTSLYLVPTLYHDLLAHPAFAGADIASVRRLGYAGAAMTHGLMARIMDAFQPELFVNHYGSSEVYTFAIDQAAQAKPGSAGRAGINQDLRVVALGTGDPSAMVPVETEGEIIATLSGDEAFEGYWRRPDADAKSLRGGWYFTGDTGFFDAEGDLFVTGRVDDMIITGGENVTPAEVENCLSLHPAVAECAVVGLPDERWGKIVTAYVVPRAPVDAADLDAHCRASTLAPFKRPRRYVLVDDLPKSPVGKLLRRKLVEDALTSTPETHGQ